MLKRYCKGSEKFDMRKVQLMITINLFIFKTLVIHSKNDAKQVMINDKVNEVIGELFQSLRSRHQTVLETFMKGSNFFFDYAICCITNVIKLMRIMVDHVQSLPNSQ